MFRRTNAKVHKKITKSRKNCGKLARNIAKSLYRGEPAILPGTLGTIPAPGPAMAAAWCSCKAGRYEHAMKILQKTALFGWSDEALPAYTYLLGILKDPETGIDLLQTGCDKNGISCRTILKTLKQQERNKK